MSTICTNSATLILEDHRLPLPDTPVNTHQLCVHCILLAGTRMPTKTPILQPALGCKNGYGTRVY
jgi:hypothetical protein